MMQLLQKTTVSPQSELFQVLEDIVKKVEIKSNFMITHPDYQSLELPEEVEKRFLSLPDNLQKKYLSLQLRSFLYGIYYNGSISKDLEKQNQSVEVQLDLENNSFLGIDLAFYEELHNSNHGEGYFDSGWSIIDKEDDNSLIVFKSNLRLHIKPDIHLKLEEKNAQIGDIVAIQMPKNLLQNGFYVAVGNLGTQNPEPSLQTVRIYFNLTPQGSINMMDSLTQELNKLEIPFTFKVLYNPSDYGRYDSGVLYFNKLNYPQIKPVLINIHQKFQQEFQEKVPLFTLKIASGLGLAEEPNQKFAIQESFGMNRCQIIANGLLNAWDTGDDSAGNKIDKIIEQFSLLGIDFNRPYLNANSEDIYL